METMQAAGNFAATLLDIETVSQEQPEGLTSLAKGFSCTLGEELEEKVFPNMKQHLQDFAWLYERDILV